MPDEDPDTSYALTLIVKCIEYNETNTAILTDLKAFANERTMYMAVLPELEALSGDTFAPQCYVVRSEPLQLFVFNDLTQLGYTMMERRTGLDFEHAKLVMNKLAHFHAASMALGKKQPDLVTSFDTGMTTDPMIVEGVFKPNLDQLLVSMQQWVGFEDIRDKLTAIKVSEHNWYCAASR